MAILKIEEKHKELTTEQSLENKEQLKKHIRLCWERGDEVKLEKFLPLYPLLELDFENYQKWYHRYALAEFIEPYLSSEANEIVFHSFQIVSILKGTTREFKSISSLNKQDFKLAIELLARQHGQNFNYLNPFVSFTIDYYGFPLRISLSHESITPLKTHKIFIRIMRTKEFPLQNYLTKEEVIQKAIKQKKNILVAGATSSGKTSFIRTLLKEIPECEHTIIIEDTYELKSRLPHFTHMLAREDLSIDKLLTYALRMTPDRVILGEVRSHEVITTILALNTGHQGFMTSLHANNALDALHRLTLLFNLYSSGHPMKYQDVLNLVVKNIDLVVFLKDKSVTEIIEPHATEDNNIYYNKVNLESVSCS